jgi:hypothetical protein
VPAFYALMGYILASSEPFFGNSARGLHMISAGVADPRFAVCRFDWSGLFADFTCPTDVRFDTGRSRQFTPAEGLGFFDAPVKSVAPSGVGWIGG